MARILFCDPMERITVRLSLVCFGEKSECNPSDRVVHGCWEGFRSHAQETCVGGKTYCGVIQPAPCLEMTTAFMQFRGKPADGDTFRQDEKAGACWKFNSHGFKKKNESKEGKRGIWQDIFSRFLLGV